MERGEAGPRAITMFSNDRYIADGYKLKMTLKVALLVLAGTAALCASFYTGLHREISDAYPDALDVIRIFHAGALRSFIVQEAVMILLVGAAAAGLTLVMSHRIAGPLWRVKQSAKAIGSGDLTQNISFRKDDEIKVLADQMNKITSGLKWRLEDISAAHVKLGSDLESLKRLVDKDGFKAQESLALTRGILDSSKDIMNKLSEIKTR